MYGCSFSSRSWRSTMALIYLNKLAMNNFDISKWKIRLLFIGLLFILFVLHTLPQLTSGEILSYSGLIIGIITTIIRRGYGGNITDFKANSSKPIEAIVFYLYSISYSFAVILTLCKIVEAIIELVA